MTIDWRHYQISGFYDELLATSGQPRQASKVLCDYLASLSDNDLSERKTAAELAIQVMGITFTVYSEGGSIDRAWPFDIVPRIIPKREWDRTEAGLKQRVRALNQFIDDIYHEQRIVKDKVFPADVLAQSVNFRSQCVGIEAPRGVWAHICGSDLVRDKDGTIYVLEDNLRIPSGVSYMLENRVVTKRVFPELFENQRILPVDDYCSQLYDMLTSLSPRPGHDPQVVVLTPGIYNSAYFEHSYLAQQMGVELVEGSDLEVGDDDCVYMRTIEGRERVDVIYRRVDDLFLDPEAFRPDSALGVPGLLRAWRQGKVALANAPGAGVADDKVVYAYVPAMIKYYLDEEPIIPNVPSYLCMHDKDREYVLQNLDKLVVKPANESGGYGMLVGPHAKVEERRRFATLIQEHPRNYMAQPTLTLSTAPTLCMQTIAPRHHELLRFHAAAQHAGHVSYHVEPRHLDLRPFILSGADTYVTTGGLTRVALKRGSLVVNSSQGGGSKDTWIVDTEE